MAKIYVEFGLEVFDKTLIKYCYDTMKLLGNIKIQETRRNTTIIDYSTSPKDIIDLEILSDEICSKIEPVKSELKHLIAEFSDKVYSDICFVKVSDEKDLSIKINKRLISLVNALNIEIQFDGF